MIPISLSMSGRQHAELKKHLYPGDGKEAAAVLLCGRSKGEYRHRLLVRRSHPIQYADCSVRTDQQLVWPTTAIIDALNEAEKNGWSVVKVHSHPTGYRAFSAIDDKSDADLLPAIKSWVGHAVPHGSAIMLPGGEMFGRILGEGAEMRPLSWINVVGDDLHFWYSNSSQDTQLGFAASHSQVLGKGTTERLQRLSVGVVGCSGTGSPVIQQLVRLGVGEIVLVDDDRVEERNLNRILGTRASDAVAGHNKANVLARDVQSSGLGTTVRAVARNLSDPVAVSEVAQCDIVFGCMDTVDGRFLLNTLATHYTLAYIDLGIRIDTFRRGDRKGDIREICGTVHYLQPDRSSLLSRGLFTMDDVRKAGLARKDPKAYADQVKDGYIAGIDEARPAVITVNMHASTIALNELLSRLHPYRVEPNNAYASVTFSLSSMDLIFQSEDSYQECRIISGDVGYGDRNPLLGLPQLSERGSSRLKDRDAREGK